MLCCLRLSQLSSPQHHYTLPQKCELKLQKAQEGETAGVWKGIMEDEKLRLMRKEGMLQKRMKCLVKDDTTVTPTEDIAMETGEKGRRLLQQSSHSKLFPSMTSLTTAKTSWPSFLSLPSQSPFSFYKVHVINFAIHLAWDCSLLISL